MGSLAAGRTAASPSAIFPARYVDKGWHVYPAAFEYEAPGTLDEALTLVDRYGLDAKVLAGGQSLIPLLRLRFATPEVLIDINRVGELSYITEDDGVLRIGALTRHNEIASSQLIRERYPAMAAAAPRIADPLVRNLGTIGGSLVHADPEGDWASVVLALRGEVVLRSVSGVRVMAMRDFLQGMFTTALEPNELLTEIRIPGPGRFSGGTYLKLDRKVGDFATVAAAVQLELGGGGLLRRGARRIQQAGVVLTAVGPSNTVAEEAEAFLAGATPDEETFARAADLAAAAVEPHDDGRGSARYKRHIARLFVHRGLRTAYELAGRRGGQ